MLRGRIWHNQSRLHRALASLPRQARSYSAFSYGAQPSPDATGSHTVRDRESASSTPWAPFGASPTSAAGSLASRSPDGTPAGSKGWGNSWGGASTSPEGRSQSDVGAKDDGLLPHERLARDRAAHRQEAVAQSPSGGLPTQDLKPSTFSQDLPPLRPRISARSHRPISSERSRNHPSENVDPASSKPHPAQPKWEGSRKPPRLMHSVHSGAFRPRKDTEHPPRTDQVSLTRNPQRDLPLRRPSGLERSDGANLTPFGARHDRVGPFKPFSATPGTHEPETRTSRDSKQETRQDAIESSKRQGGNNNTQQWGHLRRRGPPPGSSDAKNFEHPQRLDNSAASFAALEAAAARPSRDLWAKVEEKSGDAWDWGGKPNSSPKKSDSSNKTTDDWTLRPSRQERDRDASRREGRERTKKSRASRSRYDDNEDDWIDDDMIEERRRRKEQKKAERRQRELAAEEEAPKSILLPEFISVSNLAVALGVKQDVFLRQLEELGFENIGYESIMSGETAALVAQEYGFEPSVDTGEGVDLKPRPPPDDPSSLPPRPPVVTIMGHVDHGKTTLLDWLRKSSIAAQEHGGITQHIGAFSVKMSSGKTITFLDTPGHAAFLNMRQRGAHVTDIVILVVAADDSVKPQTLEALKHARLAKVPIIVAINKIDKEGVRIDLVKSDLAKHGVEIEDYGGDVQVVCVSGKTGQGMAELEENILTLSEILDFRAETDGMAEGWVLESTIKPIGRVATVLVKRGTLRKGDYVVAGKTWAKVRSLRNEAGAEVDSAPPGTAVEILGWKDAPEAGDLVLQAPDEGRAKDAAEYRREFSEREEAVAQIAAQQEQEKRSRALEQASSSKDSKESDDAEAAEISGPKVVNFIVKGDVHGSAEAVSEAIMGIGNNEVRPQVLRSAAGMITEWDVELATTTGAMIVNFNNTIPVHIKRLAEESGVKILDHTIIYHLTNEVRDTLSQHLTPDITTKVLGEAEVLQVFPINVRGRVYRNVAGCRIRNGQVTRNGKYRVIRKGEQIFEGNLDSLKHGKKDVTEMKKGSECGLSFENWQDFKEGDIIQAFEEISTPRHL
ncbi:hypothetical protein VTK73DRAFT_2310 [Phialemonium thermophilum]|uniref:Translation initiation factor IF-2, mitochondrial n=1 Tax=Phialemonium thermophilum TaxID=223376 RepID=A0ABR3X548_9PEZI